jgi:hypothetical protein
LVVAKTAEGKAEHEGEQNRHENQEHEGLEVTRELQDVFECDVENASHGFISSIIRWSSALSEA